MASATTPAGVVSSAAENPRVAAVAANADVVYAVWAVLRAATVDTTLPPMKTTGPIAAASPPTAMITPRVPLSRFLNPVISRRTISIPRWAAGRRSAPMDSPSSFASASRAFI